MNSQFSDFFSRQREIPWFSQENIEKLTVSILGVGGIGCNVSMLLSRLGVDKIHLIDHDIIEPSNLNRQILFSKSEIGQKKARTAKDTLDRLDNLKSEIIENDFDIFNDWQRTIRIIKESDYIINCLDLPEIKRTLIGILCLKVKKPMIYAGTDPHSGYSGMIVFQGSKENEPCHECLQGVLHSIENQELRTLYNLSNIEKPSEIDWLKLEREDYKKSTSGATTIVTAMFSSILAVNSLIHDLHNQSTPHRIIFDLFTNEIEQYILEPRKDCIVCSK